MPGRTSFQPVGVGAGGRSLAILIGSGILVLAGVFVPPDRLLSVILVVAGGFAIFVRPQWGLAFLLVTSLVRYGITNTTGLRGYLATGQGLLTVNNALGLMLAATLGYRTYVSGDWSFLRNRQVRILLLITACLLLSGLLQRSEFAEFRDVGLPTGGQDVRRLLVSRALFLLLVVGLLRKPGEIRLLLGVFLALSLAAVWGGLSASLAGTGFLRDVAGYRAGGSGAGIWIGGTYNPNRLALSATLAIAYVWEFGQTRRASWYGILSVGVISVMALAVVMSASRSGVLCLGITFLFLVGRGSQRKRAIVSTIALLGVLFLLVGRFLSAPAAERLSNIPGITESESGLGEGSVNRRRYSLHIATKIIAAHPIVGVGAGNWETARFGVDPLRAYNHPHNSYLLAFSEGGVVVFGLYMLLFWSTLRGLRRIEDDPEAMSQFRREGIAWILTATRTAIMSYAIFSVFGDIWRFVPFYLLIGLAVSLIEYSRRNRQVLVL